MTFNTRDFRTALGSFATGVCVICTECPERGPIGITINSFSSVSLEPPLVLWSLQNSSSCFELFEDHHAFSINILSADQQEVSKRCAQRGGYTLPSDSVARGVTGVPVFPGAMTTFECSTWARYPGGDHQIIVGEVNHFTHLPATTPLLFYKGSYSELRPST